MKFSIRYEQNGQQQTVEIDANSPDEAVVKFRYVRPAQKWSREQQWRVISVCAAEMREDVSWA